MDEVVYPLLHVKESDRNLVERIAKGLGFVADITKADAFIYYPASDGKATIVAHARPHSLSPLYQEDLTGRQVSLSEKPLVAKALHRRGHWRRQGSHLSGEAPVIEESYSIWDEKGRVIGALVFESNLLEYERRRRRSSVFQLALYYLHEMARRGLMEQAESFSPVGELDGILVVDNQGIIRYISGIAANLYRKIGLMRDLRGQTLSALPLTDRRLLKAALSEGSFIEEEGRAEGNVWVRKVLPIYEPPNRWQELLSPWLGRPVVRLAGAMMVIHDATEERRKEQELKVKTAMIKEIHHRIKNNLQTVAALLRLQARRVTSEEAKTALKDSVHRILSMAVIHEFLSEHDSGLINIKEICRRIMKQAQEGMLIPEKQIRMEFYGPDIELPSEQATACALVINELIQNALEHGYRDRTTGTISVHLEDLEDRVKIVVHDDGQGLPEGFDPVKANSLGLQIVRTLVQDDLGGEFHLESKDGQGTSAIVVFPKTRK